MTNFAIEKQFKTLGVPFHRAKVGDRYVLEIMLKEGIDLGGEGSGHLIILDKQTTGDGIVSSLQVLSVAQLATALRSNPFFLKLL